MKKGKVKLKLKKELKELLQQYQIDPQSFFEQLQEDLINSLERENYQSILAQLYLTESIAFTAKVDRGSVEAVLEFMRSYEKQQKAKESLPSTLSQISKTILKECKYERKHSKN